MSDLIGEFSLNHAGTTYMKDANGNLVQYANFQGTADGFGQVHGTLILSQALADAGASSGTISWAAKAFQDDGTVLGGFGEGTWKQSSGEQRWTVNMLTEISNGDKLRSEGEISLETLVYSGKIFNAD